MDRALRTLGIGAAAGEGKPSAVQQLLGGDSAGAAADTSVVTDGILASLIQLGAAAGTGGMPGEYMVPETAFPRVDSILRIPEVARLMPRGVELRWASTPLSVGVQSYRFLYALEDKPIITGNRLVDASAQIDPLTNGSIVVFDLDRAGPASSAMRRTARR
jgi:preprotein translocase subunit SecD